MDKMSYIRLLLNIAGEWWKMSLKFFSNAFGAVKISTFEDLVNGVIYSTGLGN